MMTTLLILTAETPEQAAFYVILRIFAGFVCLGLIGATIYLARHGSKIFSSSPLASGESYSSRRYIKFGVFAVLFSFTLIAAVVALLLH